MAENHGGHQGEGVEHVQLLKRLPALEMRESPMAGCTIFCIIYTSKVITILQTQPGDTYHYRYMILSVCKVVQDVGQHPSTHFTPKPARVSKRMPSVIL